MLSCTNAWCQAVAVVINFKLTIHMQDYLSDDNKPIFGSKAALFAVGLHIILACVFYFGASTKQEPTPKTKQEQVQTNAPAPASKSVKYPGSKRP
jgi:uncharacterized membrane protein